MSQVTFTRPDGKECSGFYVEPAAGTQALPRFPAHATGEGARFYFERNGHEAPQILPAARRKGMARRAASARQ